MHRSTVAVAIEAPLEIRVAGRPLAVTLRTPGHDIELTLGFLLAEGVIESRADVDGWQITTATPDNVHSGAAPRPDDADFVHRSDTAVVDVELHEPALERWARRRVEREFRSNSACGACGKPSLEDLYIEPLRAGGRRAAEESRPTALDDVRTLIDRAASAQHLFKTTGAVHGAAAFDGTGACLAVFEDVGRHNAVDKLVGWAVRGRPGDGATDDGQRPLDAADHDLLDGLLLFSTGRAGFEIVQKALRARAAGVVALGAATDWAVELARDGGLVLIGFGAGEPIRYS